MAEKRSLVVCLDDILESVTLIENYISNLKQDDFINSIEKQDAVMRRLEIMGEAVKLVPVEFRLMHPDVPWKKVAGLRDIVIHHYFGISAKRIWNIVINDLPSLKNQISIIRSSIIR